MQFVCRINSNICKKFVKHFIASLEQSLKDVAKPSTLGGGGGGGSSCFNKFSWDFDQVILTNFPENIVGGEEAKKIFRANIIIVKKNFRTKGRFPLGGIFRSERNLSLSFLISSTREITRQRKIPLRAEYSAYWKTGLT